jgi:hypothetical protein
VNGEFVFASRLHSASQPVVVGGPVGELEA